jgi:hypothetical protein
MIVPTRHRGQAIVEFGLIALLFTALMFAVVDFGLLLNTWISVSSGAREIARAASVGKRQPTLQIDANRLSLLAVGTRGFTGGKCCVAASAVEVRVVYLDPSSDPIPGGASQISSLYPYGDVDTRGACTDSIPPAAPVCHPFANDMVKVTLIAHGAQVITPLLRPIFGCVNGSSQDCYVGVSTTTIMRFEGREF